MSLQPGMPFRELTKWAREMALDSIDKMIQDAQTHGIDGQVLDWDDLQALKKERDRVAKLFNLPTKYR